MRRLFTYEIGLAVWFFLLYNVERLIAPINIASFVYVFAAGLSVLILALPALNKWSSIKLFLLVLVPFFLLKWLLGYEIAGQNLAITITEMTALYITLILSRLLGQGINQIRDEISLLTIGNFRNGVNGFSDGQAEIYSEVRRARRFNRPAALLTIAPNRTSVDLAMNRFIEEARNGIARSYINARVAKMLEGQLKDSDVITKYNDYFVILLPETSLEQVPKVISRLQNSSLEKLEIPLEIGFSTFPDEAVTFSGLLEQAKTKMTNTRHVLGGFFEETQPTIEKSSLGINQAPTSILLKKD